MFVMNVCHVCHGWPNIQTCLARGISNVCQTMFVCLARALDDYDVPLCERQTTHGSCKI